MRLIDADAFKEAISYHCEYLHDNTMDLEDVLDLIDDAPTVEPHYVSDLPDDVVKTLQTLAIDYSDGIAIFERKRPQDEWIKFADYVARNVVSEDFSEDVDFYAEVLCRKLVKLGLVKLDGDTYKYCGADKKGGAE